MGSTHSTHKLKVEQVAKETSLASSGELNGLHYHVNVDSQSDICGEDQYHDDVNCRLYYRDALIGGLASMLESGCHSDINIVVGDQTFRCHRVVLAAMSQYFHDNLSGFEDDEVHMLTDIDKDTFRKLLSFFYTGSDEFCNIDDTVIVDANEKLQIPNLTEIRDKYRENKNNLGKSETDCKDAHLEALTSGLTSLLSTRWRTDVIVDVSDRMFLCHKVVLCATSSYFDAMFTHDMREGNENSVKLQDTDAASFDKMLTFMYSGKDVVTIGNVHQLVQAASLTQLHPLLDTCDAFMASKISQSTVDDCIGHWTFAELYQCRKAADRARMSVLRNFVEISHTQTFLKLSLENIISLIKDDALAAPDEDAIVEAVLRWILADETARKQHIRTMLGSLRMPLVSSVYCSTQNSKTNDLIRGSPGYFSFVAGMQAAFRQPEDYRTSSSDEATHRKYGLLHDVAVVIGSGCLNYGSVICYSFLTEKWFALPNLPFKPEETVGVCNHGDRIIVCGGCMCGDMAEYNPQTNIWTRYPPMLRAR
jgi:hypothetical protein